MAQAVLQQKLHRLSVGDRGDGVREAAAGLDFNPYALDVLLVYPYDAQAACGLYAEICDLMKEE